GLASGGGDGALGRIGGKGFASPADVGHAAPSGSRNVQSAPAISRFSPTPLLTGNAPGTIRRTKRWRQDYDQGRGARRPGRPRDDDHGGGSVREARERSRARAAAVQGKGATTSQLTGWAGLPVRAGHGAASNPAE